MGGVGMCFLFLFGCSIFWPLQHFAAIRLIFYKSKNRKRKKSQQMEQRELNILFRIHTIWKKLHHKNLNTATFCNENKRFFLFSNIHYDTQCTQTLK